MDNKNTIKDHLDTSFDYDGIVVSKELLQRTMAAIKADEEDRKEQEKDKQQSWTKKPRYIRRYIHSLGVAAAAVVLLIGATQVFRSSKKSLVPNNMNESSLMQDNLNGGYGSRPEENNAGTSDAGISDERREQESGSHTQNNALAEKDDSDGMSMFSQSFPLEGIEVVKLTMEGKEGLREIEDKEIIAEIIQSIKEVALLEEKESEINDRSDEGIEEEAKGEQETDSEAGIYHIIFLTDTDESFDVLIDNQIQIRRAGEVEYKEYKMNKAKSQGNHLLEKLEEILGGNR